MALALAACGGGGQSSADGTAAAGELPSARSSTTRVAQPPNTEGRLLASNCYQCHGTLGLGGFDKIRGSEADEVLEFMTKTASKDIMAAHAQGYTTEQLKKIIAYLQQ
jgi:mono/diheme cytochrome c family protein